MFRGERNSKVIVVKNILYIGGIYEKVKNNIDDDGNVIRNGIPQFHNIKSCFNRIRKNALPQIPDNFDSINFDNLDESLRETSTTRRFLLKHDGDLNIIIFATNKHTTQKTKFSIKDFFSKYNQIRRKLNRKSLTENFIFCAMTVTTFS